MLFKYELVSECQSCLWLLLAFSLAHRIEAKSPVCGLGFFLRTSGDPVWHSDTCPTFIPLPPSAANNVLAKPKFSVFGAMLSLSPCPNVRPDPGFGLSQRLAIITCSTPFHTSCVFISRDADSLPLTYKLVRSA